MNSENFVEKKFDIGNIDGISSKTIEGHLKLYGGYVKHANIVLEQINELSKDAKNNAYAIGELRRRFSFEFNGIRNHEYYFEQFEGGARELNPSSALGEKISKTWGNIENFFEEYKLLCLTRGIGWAILYFDPITDRLILGWTDEQHLGELIGLNVILAIDMWEHSFLLDYIPSEKNKYVEACLKNTNFEVVEKRFTSK